MEVLGFQGFGDLGFSGQLGFLTPLGFRGFRALGL